MNFWEARQAALDGKKVKMLGSSDHYDLVSFTANFVQFDNAKINAQWEIVEEPKNYKAYVNIYADGMYKYGTHNGITKDSDCKGTIEIITDETGKLISAKNV